MKILLTRSMLPGDIQYIKDGLDKRIKGQYQLAVPESYTEDALCAAAQDADVLLGPYVTAKILKAAKGLRLIQVPWTGMDTFDFASLSNCGIPVCNTHSNADCVAEIAMALVLDLLKKVSYHDRKMRRGNWNRDQQPLSLKSRMVSGQTVCILGYGSIGRRIGKLFSAFGARVIAVDAFAGEDGIASRIFTADQMPEALAQADVVICALPLTDATRGMINADAFRGMKDGAVFVNISRAAVVDEDAVWDALQNGKISAFGADVWWNAPRRGETESYPSQKHAFWKLDNVVMSPHRAGFVADALPHLDGAIENIIALAEGRGLSGQVDIAKGF